MTFIEWCIVNKKDEFLDQMDEADLRHQLDSLQALGKDALGLLGGRRPRWYGKLRADRAAKNQARIAATRERQAENPITQRKKARRAMAHAELARRREEEMIAARNRRPPGCPPCPC